MSESVLEAINQLLHAKWRKSITSKYDPNTNQSSQLVENEQL